jgi:hypothetical protein
MDEYYPFTLEYNQEKRGGRFHKLKTKMADKADVIGLCCQAELFWLKA